MVILLSCQIMRISAQVVCHDLSVQPYSHRSFTGDDISKEWTFEGNVKAKQGDVSLSCDRLVVVYYEKKGANTGKDRASRPAKDLDYLGNMKSIAASGNVKIVQNERMATADEALFDYVKRTIRLKGGHPILQDRSGVLTGDPIFILLDENRIVTPMKIGPKYPVPHQNGK